MKNSASAPNPCYNYAWAERLAEQSKTQCIHFTSHSHFTDFQAGSVCVLSSDIHTVYRALHDRQSEALKLPPDSARCDNSLASHNSTAKFRQSRGKRWKKKYPW